MLDRKTLNLGNNAFVLSIVWGKDNGENIMKSITEGPFQMGTFIQTPAEETEGALQLGPERARVFTNLFAKEKERYKAGIRATNILLQGNLATVQDDRVVVRMFVTRYNVNNQGKPFAEEQFARGYDLAGMLEARTELET
ncbi:hypothetical protein Tco_1475725 [Tanacetum coccineum]